MVASCRRVKRANTCARAAFLHGPERERDVLDGSTGPRRRDPIQIRGLETLA